MGMSKVIFMIKLYIAVNFLSIHPADNDDGELYVSNFISVYIDIHRQCICMR